MDEENKPIIIPDSPINPETPLKKPSRKKFWIIIGIVVILLTALGIWGYCLDKKEQKTSGAPTTETKPTTTKEGNWTEYKDAHGFSVQIPEGWKVKVDDSGLVRMGPDPENKKGPLAFAQTLIFSDSKNNEQVLDSIVSELKNTFPNFEITSKRTLDKYQSLVCQIKYKGSEYLGAMNISASGKNAFVSGLVAEKNEFAIYRSDLLKILSTFKYNRTLQDPSKVSGLTQMVSWKDPNEGAFTVDVPQGWDVSGGLVRPYIDAGIKLIVTSGDKGIQIENPYPPMYTTPNWALEMAGFTEGSHYNPSGGLAQDMIVMSEKSAEEYIRSLLPDYLSLSLTSAESRSDLVETVPQMPWTTNTTAAEGVLGGDGKKHKAIVIEQGIEMAGVGMWAVVLVHYWAPESEIGLVEEIVEAMDKSFKLDSAWASREQAEVAKRVGIINQAGSEIAEMISSTFEYQSRVQDRTRRQWSDAMLGINRVYNPKTGEEYEVPVGSEHYWSDGYNVVGTKVSEPPTYHDDWTELVPLD